MPCSPGAVPTGEGELGAWASRKVAGARTEASAARAAGRWSRVGSSVVTVPSGHAGAREASVGGRCSSGWLGRVGPSPPPPGRRARSVLQVQRALKTSSSSECNVQLHGDTRGLPVAAPDGDIGRGLLGGHGVSPAPGSAGVYWGLLFPSRVGGQRRCAPRASPAAVHPRRLPKCPAEVLGVASFTSCCPACLLLPAASGSHATGLQAAAGVAACRGGQQVALATPTLHLNSHG